MIMKAIGFKAEGMGVDGKYDCSFMIIFPVGSVTASAAKDMEQKSITQFHQFHPTGQIIGRMERTLVGHPGGNYKPTSEYA